jgi:hypothetical protein
MALRREEADERPELRVVRGRGRPREPYVYLSAVPDDGRLGKLLLHSFRREGPYPNWYTPAAYERERDTLTVAWLKDYRALFPDDWKRMRRNTKRYPFWSEKTAHKRTKQEKTARVFRAQIADVADAWRRIMSIYSLINRGATVPDLSEYAPQLAECFTFRRVTCATCHHEFLTAGDSHYCSVFCGRFLSERTRRCK